MTQFCLSGKAGNQKGIWFCREWLSQISINQFNCHTKCNKQWKMG